MSLPRSLKLTILVLLIGAVGIGFAACSRSKGQDNNANASASPTPAAISVNTTAAVSRQLPRYFEATGSLTPNEQADVAAIYSGKDRAGRGRYGGDTGGAGETQSWLHSRGLADAGICF